MTLRLFPLSIKAVALFVLRFEISAQRWIVTAVMVRLLVRFCVSHRSQRQSGVDSKLPKSKHHVLSRLSRYFMFVEKQATLIGVRGSFAAPRDASTASHSISDLTTVATLRAKKSSSEGRKEKEGQQKVEKKKRSSRKVTFSICHPSSGVDPRYLPTEGHKKQD